MEIAKLTYPSLKGIKLNGGTCLNKRISEEEKNQISHRKKATDQLLKFLKERENEHIINQ